MDGMGCVSKAMLSRHVVDACSAAEAISGDPGAGADQLEVQEEPGLRL